MANKTFVALIACLVASVLPAQAALQKPQETSAAEERGSRKEVWFSWSGRALPDTNAPLTLRTGAEPKYSSSPSPMLLADSASASASQPSKHGWFSWWGKARPDTNAPLMRSDETEKKSVPAKALVASEPAPEKKAAVKTPSGSGPEAKQQPDSQSRGWFSWWGKARPDTNAPVMRSGEAEKKPAPAKALVASEPAPEKKGAVTASSKPGPEAKQQPDSQSRGWFSWWGKARSDGAKPTPEKPAATAGSAVPATEDLKAKPADTMKQAFVEVESGGDLRGKPHESKPSPWRLAAGVLQRRIGGSSMSTVDSYSRNAAIPRQGSSTHWRGGHVGSASGYSDREYDDGYVLMDDWTVLDGGTGVWGFKNGSQVHDGYVDFHAVTGARTTYSRDTETSSAGWDKSSDEEWGGYAAIDWLCYQNSGVQLGLGVSASHASFSGSGSGSTFRDVQSWRTTRTEVTDRYSLAGLSLASGSAPAAWGMDAKGPIIDNIPTHRSTTTRQISAGRYEAFNTIAQKVSMDLYTLSMGLSLGFDWWRIQAACMAGPTLNYIDAEGCYDETLYASRNGSEPSVLGSWRDTRTETEVAAGFYLQAGLFFDVIDGLQLGMFGRYDWLEDFLGSVGQSRYEVNPSGGSYGATLGLNF